VRSEKWNLLWDESVTHSQYRGQEMDLDLYSQKDDELYEVLINTLQKFKDDFEALKVAAANEFYGAYCRKGKIRLITF
jgi:hypothetical protein